MSKPWTTREQKDCAQVYSTQGPDAAVALTGRTKPAVYLMMQDMGISAPYNRSKNIIKKERRWFREDIALMLELLNSGLTSNLIAEYFDTSAGAIRGAVSLAKSKGYEVFPERNK
jgi:hypothetical protein